MEGQRLEITYLDQNESISGELPRVGTVVRRIEGEGRNAGALARLNHPISWQGVAYGYALLLQKWPERPVGGEEEAPAFLFMIKTPEEVGAEFRFEVLDPRHVAWVFVKAL